MKRLVCVVITLLVVCLATKSDAINLNPVPKMKKIPWYSIKSPIYVQGEKKKVTLLNIAPDWNKNLSMNRGLCGIASCQYQRIPAMWRGNQHYVLAMHRKLSGDSLIQDIFLDPGTMEHSYSKITLQNAEEYRGLYTQVSSQQLGYGGTTGGKMLKCPYYNKYYNEMSITPINDWYVCPTEWDYAIHGDACRGLYGFMGVCHTVTWRSLHTSGNDGMDEATRIPSCVKGWLLAVKQFGREGRGWDSCLLHIKAQPSCVEHAYYNKKDVWTLWDWENPNEPISKYNKKTLISPETTIPF